MVPEPSVTVSLSTTQIEDREEIIPSSGNLPFYQQPSHQHQHPQLQPPTAVIVTPAGHAMVNNGNASHGQQLQQQQQFVSDNNMSTKVEVTSIVDYSNGGTEAKRARFE